MGRLKVGLRQDLFETMIDDHEILPMRICLAVL
jgi:hypothetical protein